MLTLQQIKENPTLIIERLAVKGFDGKEPIEKILELDNSRRQLQLDNDNQAASLRQLAARIGSLMKEGKKEEAEETKKEVAALKESQKLVADRLAAAELEIRNILLTIPNIPCAMVPEGKTAADNVVEKTGGPMPELGPDALPHWDLAKKYGIIDFDLGVARVHACSAPSYSSSSTKLAKQAIWKSNRPTWSTKLRDTAQASSPTRRARCTT